MLSLQAWYGGEEAGAAASRLLFGDYNPSGKLPITFYKSVKQLPGFEDYSMKAGHTDIQMMRYSLSVRIKLY